MLDVLKWFSNFFVDLIRPFIAINNVNTNETNKTNLDKNATACNGKTDLPSSQTERVSMINIFILPFKFIRGICYELCFRSISWSLYSNDPSIMGIEDIESCLLASVTSTITSKFVSIPFKNSCIYTLSITGEVADPTRIPVVFISIYGMGVCGWAGNVDCLAEDRQVYVFDLLGFGRSSRPNFITDPTLVEKQYVRSIESWRLAMKIQEMVLVAHSFGAFIASSYSLDFPEHVRHLVLIEPWGIDEKKKSEDRFVAISDWIHVTVSLFSCSTPLALLRLFGPLGPFFLRFIRRDLRNYFSRKNPDAIYDYICRCNTMKPTGETAFSNMSYSFGWAKRPMFERLCCIEIPTIFIYGSRSWMEHKSSMKLQALCGGLVKSLIIRGAGHHVNLDRRDTFNELLCKIVRKSDLRNSKAGSSVSVSSIDTF